MKKKERSDNATNKTALFPVSFRGVSFFSVISATEEGTRQSELLN
jgi:hypothetical protein